MSANDDYCELCDLPKSQCIHGQPPPAPVTKTPPRRRPAVSTRSEATRPRVSGSPARSQLAPARPVNRRWTPPEVLAPLILEVLRGAGGELEADDLFTRLGEVLGDRLRPGDTEKTPEGELRWHYAARRARQALIREGLMAKGVPGMWTLA